MNQGRQLNVFDHCFYGKVGRAFKPPPNRFVTKRPPADCSFSSMYPTSTSDSRKWAGTAPPQFVRNGKNHCNYSEAAGQTSVKTK